MTLHVNPFALPSARSAWQNEHSSFAGKIGKSLAGGLYDMYIGNPRAMTFGNAHHVIANKHATSTIEKCAAAAFIALSACYTSMLYGATLLAGAALLPSMKASSGAVAIARAVHNLGKTLFLAGSVPIYGVCYALPKNALQALPRFATTVANAVQSIASQVFKRTIVPLWHHVIQPTLSAIRFTAQAITRVAATAVRNAARLIAQSATWLFQNTIVPSWKYVIQPTLSAIRFTAQAIVRVAATAVRNAARLIAQSATWLFQNTIVPSWKYVIQPTLSAIRFTAQAITRVAATAVRNAARLTAQSATWLFQNTIVPLWNYALKPLLLGTIWTVTKALQGVQMLALKTAQACKTLFNHTVVPLWTHAIAPLSRMVSQSVIYTAHKVSEFVSIIYRATVPPTARAVQRGISYSGEVFNNVRDATTRAWQAITG